MNESIIETEGTRHAKAELRKLIAKAAKKEKRAKFTISAAAAALGRLGGLAGKGKPAPKRAQSSEHCRKAVNVRWAKYRENQAATRR